MLKLFKQTYELIILEATLDELPAHYREMLIKALSDHSSFRRFVTGGIPDSDKEMSTDLLKTYEDNKLTAIKSAIVWRAMLRANPILIFLDCNREREYDNGDLVVSFDAYNSSIGKIQNIILRLDGRSKAIFESQMREKVKNVEKMYNTAMKYGALKLT